MLGGWELNISTKPFGDWTRSQFEPCLNAESPDDKANSRSSFLFLLRSARLVLYYRDTQYDSRTERMWMI